MLKRLYNWTLSWAHTPYGWQALFLVAFAEASFFPIPPDVLLVALAVALPRRAFFYAGISSVGSVAGGVAGYLIGLYFMDAIGEIIIDTYGLEDRYHYIQELYNRYDAWAVGIAGFTPIPYKLFTITAGAFRIDFTVFLIASAVSRAARFFLEAVILYRYGDSIREFIDRYFNLITVVITVVIIVIILLFKWL